MGFARKRARGHHHGILGVVGSDARASSLLSRTKFVGFPIVKLGDCPSAENLEVPGDASAYSANVRSWPVPAVQAMNFTRGRPTATSDPYRSFGVAVSDGGQMSEDGTVQSGHVAAEHATGHAIILPLICQSTDSRSFFPSASSLSDKPRCSM